MVQRSSTLKVLAEHLDLSITTVSRALAGNPSVAARTRERVTAAAREFGYVPNLAARQLVSGRSGFAAFVLPVRGPSYVDSYLGEFLTGLGEGLATHGVDLLLAPVQPDRSELAVLRHVIESGRADGVVVARIAEEDERVGYLRERRVPFVMHGRLLDETAPVSWLDTDSGTAFGEAFDMLYELGHRRFGLVSITDRMTFRHLRERGLRAAIARRGDQAVELEVVAAPRFDRAAAVAAIDGLLHGPRRPTAVIGLFDELALLVLERAAHAGLRVPHDLSVVGFDNVPAAAYAPPGLTTFDACTRRSAKEIGEMLVSLVEDRGGEPLRRLVRPEPVLRGSHGPAPRSERAVRRGRSKP
ncbi:MAG TPA: substrate-binding domain-containing protein [Trueperaceae bacterium]|nr:substrate-binding domain-containing protein [Trueperaceae bacterium]